MKNARSWVVEVAIRPHVVEVGERHGALGDGCRGKGDGWGMIWDGWLGGGMGGWG
jgi:hypothetical protein